MDDSILKVKNLTKYYGVHSKLKNKNEVLKNINLNINPGESIAIVGESGCGKTTLLKSIFQLATPYEGEIYFKNTLLNKSSIKRFSNQMQIIFQNYMSALNPKMKIIDIILEGCTSYKLKRSQKIKIAANLMMQVGLETSLLERYPEELSGGQRQRVAIARALAVNPEFIALDEPLSSLDATVQMQILCLLKTILNKNNISCVFVTHDIMSAKFLASKIVVMCSGKIVEMADTYTVLNKSLHPYTKKLLGAMLFDYSMPFQDIFISDYKNLKGCEFVKYCNKKTDICLRNKPEFEKKSANHFVLCHL